MRPIPLALLLLLAGCATTGATTGNTDQNPATGTDTWLDAATGEVNQMPEHSLRLTSSAFADGGPIPPRYTCDDMDESPPLAIAGVPEGAKSLVLIVDDPDAPVGTWDHWILFDIPPETKIISAGQEPEGIRGKNSWGRTDYGGPCPPSGTHRYRFKLYALDTTLGLVEGSTKQQIEQAMRGHILAETLLIGTYARQR